MKVAKYFDVQHSAMSVKGLEDSSLIDTLKMKLSHIGVIAVMLSSEAQIGRRGIDEACSAIETISTECQAVADAIWEQITSAEQVAA